MAGKDFIDALIKNFPPSITLKEVSSRDRIHTACRYFEDHPLEQLMPVKPTIKKQKIENDSASLLRLMFFKENQYPRSDRNGDSRDRKYTLRPTGGDYRYSADDNLNNLPSALKQWIFYESSELDIENCYPTMATIFIESNATEDQLPLLDPIFQYVQNRESYISEIQRLNTINGIEQTPKEIKQMFSSFWGGAKCPANVSPMITQLHQAWNYFRDWVYTIFVGRQNHKLSKWENTNKIISKLLSAMESYFSLLIQKCIKTLNRQVTCWTYDGLFILNANGPESGTDQTNEFLICLRELLLSETDFHASIRMRFKQPNCSEWDEKCTVYEMKYDEVPVEFPAMDSNPNSLMSMPESHNYIDMKRALECRKPGYPCVFFNSSTGDYCYSPNRDGKPQNFSLSALKNAFANWTSWCVDLPAKKSFIEFWNMDPERQSYARIVCTTNPKPNEFNTWDGFWIEKYPLSEETLADPELMESLNNKADKLDNHLRKLVNDSHDNLPGNTERLYQMWEKMEAHLLQYPFAMTANSDIAAPLPIGVMFVMRTVGKTGKNMRLKAFMQMIDGHQGDGPICSSTSNLQNIGLAPGDNVKFNAFISGKLLINIDEVVIPASVNEAVKSYLTIANQPIRGMRAEVTTVPNHIRTIMTTNKETPFYPPDDDRRFQYSRSRQPPLSTEEQNDLGACYSDPRVLRLWYERRMAVKIEENYDFSANIIYTEDYADLRETVYCPEARFLENLLYANRNTRQLILTNKMIWDEFKTFSEQQGHEFKKTNASSLTQLLKDKFDVSSNHVGKPKLIKSQQRFNNSQPIDHYTLDYSDMLATCPSGMLIHIPRTVHSENFGKTTWVIDPKKAYTYVKETEAKFKKTSLNLSE